MKPGCVLHQEHKVFDSTGSLRAHKLLEKTLLGQLEKFKDGLESKYYCLLVLLIW